MSNTTSLAEIQAKYKNSGAHLLLPASGEVQISPYYKYTIMEVTADTSENSGDIFRVGNVRVGYDEAAKKDIYADVFSPAKPLLMKLSAAAGIQFDPDHTYGAYITKNCYRAKAFGAIRMPDGTGKTHADEKVINLEDEEDRIRLEFMDKSIEGIKEWKAAKAAEKLFKGEWIDTGEKNDKGYPVKKYVIADVDRQKYIERSVLVNMTLLRKTFAEKAMTGAILRVIRALIGMKGMYTMEELKKPFVVPRVTFSPDYSDPMVRQAMLEQGLNSVSNMFGGQRIAPPAPVIEAIPHRDEFDPGEYADNAAFASDHADDPAVTEPDAGYPDASDPSDDFNPAFGGGGTLFDQEPEGPGCSACGKPIEEKVYSYSMKNFGRPLCYSCQKKA